jgi:hypothetical protein
MPKLAGAETKQRLSYTKSQTDYKSLSQVRAVGEVDAPSICVLIGQSGDTLETLRNRTTGALHRKLS